MQKRAFSILKTINSIFPYSSTVGLILYLLIVNNNENVSFLNHCCTLASFFLIGINLSDIFGKVNRD